MTGAVAITTIGPGDFALAARWLNDPAINKWLNAEWRERPVDERVIAFAANGPKNRIWLIQVDGRPYGLGAVGNISTIDRSGIIWYLRGSQELRVPGVMGQAVGMLVRTAFSAFDLHSLSASLQAGNVSSERLLHSVGFHKVGVMREAFATDSGFVDRVIFDLLAEDLNNE